MPIVEILGISKVISPYLAGLRKEIQSAVAKIEELGLAKDATVVAFPPDLTGDLGGVVIVKIEGLFMKKARTKTVRDRLAMAILCIVHTFAKQHLSGYLVGYKKTEVLLVPFNTRMCSYCIESTDS